MSEYGDDLPPYDEGPEAPDAPAAEPHLAAVPGYPVSAVPGPLGDLVREAQRTGLPTALVGGAGLGAASALSMRATLKVGGESWTEPTTLWIPLIAPPGGAKSPSMRFATRDIEQLEGDAHEQYVADLNEWKSADKKERGELPGDPTVITDDATIEALARQLDASGGTSAVFSDELRGFLSGIGQYKKHGGGDLARYLSLWDGAPWRYKRVGQGVGGINIYVRRPVAPIVGGLQPAYSELLGPEEDGMRPRWLPHLSLVTDLEPDTAHTPRSWKDLVGFQYPGRHMGREWSLDAATLAEWKGARKEWKAASKRADAGAGISAALLKADRQAARVALVLAETLSPGRGGLVPPEAMTAAIEIVNYSLECWRALPERGNLSLSRTEESIWPAVDKLVAWLEAREPGPNGERRANYRDAQRAKVGGARTASAFATVVRHYELMYPGSVCEEPSNTRGPNPTFIYAPTRSVRHSPKPPTPSSTPTSTGGVDSVDSGDSFRPRPNAEETPVQSANGAGDGAPASGDSSVSTEEPVDRFSADSDELVPCRAVGCPRRINPNRPEFPDGLCSDHHWTRGAA